MIVVVERRPAVADAFVALLLRQGVAAMGLDAGEFPGWIAAISETDLATIEAFLIGDCEDRVQVCQLLASRNRGVVIALCEERILDETLQLFAAGVDDVVRKPVHAKEILARVNAASRRSRPEAGCARFGPIKVFFDGRDPEIRGETLPLPRRERRILEYMTRNVGCRVTKSQVFSAVYGLCNEEFDENVIESHISKLRKRLRVRLGYDPIDSKRFLGYRLAYPDEIAASNDSELASPAQASAGKMQDQLLLAHS